jgi:chromosome partitioning protein
VTARIISVVNQKGGAGKSTVTMSLAGNMAHRGLRILVVDADPQGTSMAWSAAAPEEKPFPAAVVSLAAAGVKIAQQIRPHVAHFDRIIVDCPPSVDSPIAASALLLADIALIPTPPSPADLWATRGAVRLLQQAQVMNSILRGFVVPNRVQRTALSVEIRGLLSEIGLPVTRSSLGLRTAYQEASAHGCSIADLGSGAKAAALEIDMLATEVEALLAGKESA